MEDLAEDVVEGIFGENEAEQEHVENIAASTETESYLIDLNGDGEVDAVVTDTLMDTDGDGRDELVARQYAWSGSHSNHVGDVVTVFKIVNNRAEVADVWLEKPDGGEP